MWVKIRLMHQRLLKKNIMKSFCQKKYHTRYCKFILGVNKYASNLASKAELGRFPVIISALLQSIKYWLYLNDNPFEKYNRFSYLSLIHLDGNIASTFNHHICCVLKYFGFYHVWGNKSTMSVPKLMHVLKKKWSLVNMNSSFFNQ